MSAEEKEIKPKNDSPLESESASCLQTEEAIAKLEDHRCAICQNIIINACRIDCGHTFCRHCLNVDRENRNNGSKSTCFICDAAVTEIARNEERDKEIDALYATLPTKERLSRERTKSDRKREEDDFQKKPKETNNDVEQHTHQDAHTTQSSNSSVGSGDGAASLNPYTLLSSRTEWSNADENNNINVQVPAFYGGTFRIWRRDSEYAENESNDDVDSGDQFNQPQPPLVVHHTIQHVYHTVEVTRSEQSEILEDEASRDHSSVRSEPSSDWRNGEHDHHDHSSEYTPPPCNCNNGHFRDFRYSRYPYMSSPGTPQCIPRVYAYPHYGCGYPYATPTYHHPSPGVHAHFVPLTYQNPRTSYATPINISANSDDQRFCPATGYHRHNVNLLRNRYAHSPAHNESSSETPPHCLHCEDERRHENDSDNETDGAGLSTGDRNRYECEFHRPLQFIRLRRSHESLPYDSRGRRSRFDYDDIDLPSSVSHNLSDNEARPFREARMEISETRQEHG